MKAFIVNNFSMPQMIIDEGSCPDICVPVNPSNFTSAHPDCKSCDQFCSQLKNLFHLNPCATHDGRLEIELYLQKHSRKFTVQIKGDILKTLYQLLGMDDQTWLMIKIHNATDYYKRVLTSIQSSKLFFTPSKGRYFCEGTMPCPEDWKKCWFQYATRGFSGAISVIVGIDDFSQAELGYSKTLNFVGNDSLAVVNKAILTGEVATDLTLCASNGAALPCHKNFLEVHSSTFAAMLKDKNFVEGQTSTIKLDDMTEEGVKALLKYLYYRDITEPSINPSVAVELLTCGNKYGIEVLEQAMRVLLLTKLNDWYDINTALRLFYFGCQTEIRDEFKKKAIQILRLKPLKEVETSTDYNELFVENPEAGQELCTALLANLSLNK